MAAQPTTPREKATRVLLFFAVFFFVSGWMLLCYCPGDFLISAALSILPICVGRQFIRTIAILFFGASLLSASHMYLKDEQMKQQIQRIRTIQLRQKKTEAVKPLATRRLWRIVHAA